MYYVVGIVYPKIIIYFNNKKKVFNSNNHLFKCKNEKWLRYSLRKRVNIIHINPFKSQQI